MLNMGAHPLGWSAEFPCTRVAAFVALRSVKAQLAGAPVDDGDLHRDQHPAFEQGPQPEDLPEGEVVGLVPLDEVLARGGDFLDDEDRAALHRELDASIAEAKESKFIDAEDVLAELRAMK